MSDARVPRLQGYTDFSVVALKSENERFWTFVSGSYQWYADGGAPAALYVAIDKQDGHVWSRDEVEEYYRRKAERAA